MDHSASRKFACLAGLSHSARWPCAHPAVAPFDADQAKQHQQAWADHRGVPVEREIELAEGVKLTMVLIPPGEFLMGSTAEEHARFLEEARAANDQRAIDLIPGEGPQQRVRITEPFRLSRHEVTRGQFRQFVEAKGYKTEAERARRRRGTAETATRRWEDLPGSV